MPKHLEMLPELPKTAVGKVFKPDLRRRAIARVFDAALAEAGAGARVAEVVEDRRLGLVAEVLAGPEGERRSASPRCSGASPCPGAGGMPSRGRARRGGDPRLSPRRRPAAPGARAARGAGRSGLVRPLRPDRGGGGRRSRRRSASTCRPATRWPRSRTPAGSTSTTGRPLHDRHPAGQGRHRPPGAGAGHLHPGRAQRLVTLRYDEPRAFQTFPERAEQLDLGCTDGRAC